MEKMYKCGYCGNPTNKNGYPLTEIEHENISNEQINNAELVHGICCASEWSHEYMRMRVTREMAIDAGDLSLEGEII